MEGKELLIPRDEHGKITIDGLPVEICRDMDVITGKIVMGSRDMWIVRLPDNYEPFTDADYRFIEKATKGVQSW